MAAISKAWVTIADAAVDPDSPGDATLMTGIRDNLVHLREWIGASFFAGAVQDHNHDGQNSALVDVGPNLLRNGSFEDGGAGWTINDYSGGSHAFSTSTRHHGGQSLAFTSTVLANGGGDALSGTFIPVAGSEWYNWAAQISASVGNVSSRVSIVWYDGDQSQISEVNVYNASSTPTTKTPLGRGVQAPATARFAKIRVMGGVPGVGSTTGTVFFDDVQLLAAQGGVCIDEQTANGSPQIDFTTGIDGTFDVYEFQIIGLRPATDATILYARVSEDSGASFKSGAVDYVFAGAGHRNDAVATSSASTGAPQIQWHASGSPIGNAAVRGFSATIRLYEPADTTQRKPFIYESAYLTSGGITVSINGTAYYIGTTNPINGVRFFMNSGNIAEGTIRLYGIRKK